MNITLTVYLQYTKRLVMPTKVYYVPGASLTDATAQVVELVRMRTGANPDSSCLISAIGKM